MIKAVLFDMDGIMFDTEKIMSEGWQEAAKQLGFILTGPADESDERQFQSQEYSPL